MKSFKVRKAIPNPVLNVAIDDSFNIFFTRSGNKVYKRPVNPVWDKVIEQRTLFNNKYPCPEKHTRAMATDTKNHLYMAMASGTIDVIDTCSWEISTFLKKENCNIKHMTVDVHNNVYVLADCGYGDHAYRVKDNELEKLPVHERVIGPFAVDSKRRLYYNKYVIDNVSKYSISKLYEETVKYVCVDSKDNAYFATENGIFFMEAETYDAVRIEVNIPDIVKIEVAMDDTLYFSSIDQEHGGVYIVDEIKNV